MIRTSPRLAGIAILLTLSVVGCRQGVKKDTEATRIPDTVINDTALSGQARSDNQHLLLATVFQQQAAEYRALAYQSFTLALQALKADLDDRSVSKPRAIITDVDETVLDNSPYQAYCILQEVDYPEFWDEWCRMARARAVPGALEFFRMASGYGVDIFYVTNRKDHLREATLKNLQELGFPDADDRHLMMRTETSDKEARRQDILKDYHVSLYVGDNLNDFARDFYKVPAQRRTEVTDSLSALFGRRFILLPNPMYGDWESALYQNRNDLDKSARLLILHDMLIDPDRLGRGGE